jgi:AcrR family transcriptional regulator
VTGLRTDDDLSVAQSRIVVAALDLFSQHGVGGTSLGMIATELGLTKAAIYHQYRTKHDVVVAVAESELTRLIEVIAAAESEPDPDRARDALLAGMVDLVIERGRRVSTLLSDPVIGQIFAGHERFVDAMRRLTWLLEGPRSSHDQSSRTAILIAAISGAMMHPFSAAIDEATLRSELLQLARRYLRLQ